MGIKYGPAKLIVHKKDELVRLKKEQPSTQGIPSSRPCKPYPFQCFHDAYRYTENRTLDIPETGPSNLIDPCHEFKAFIHTQEGSPEDQMRKFTEEMVRFAAACMNSRTNGTIHFGVGDRPDFAHGQILGVRVPDKEAYVNEVPRAIEGHFEYKHVETAKKCIKPPRFVEVLNPDMTSSDKYVIEVDIVPAYLMCQENVYHVYNVERKKGKKKTKGKDEMGKLFHVRDGASSRDLLAETSKSKPLEEYNRFIESTVKELALMRKEAEDKRLTAVKSSVQGSKLREMITGHTWSLDKSHFEWYVLVTNKSHFTQLDSLEFLLEMNLIAVLDFDPESAKTGLYRYYEDQRKTNAHFPRDYKITEAVEDIASKLKLTKNTSWVFCNGCLTEEVGLVEPSDPETWPTDKGASVRDVISFLCRKDILPPKRFLVVFLLLSSVTDKMDPLLKTFNTFWEELGGTEQILCVCENKAMFTSWRDLIDAQYGVNITSRSIYELSLPEVNGTILSLWSVNRSSSSFLPCTGGGRVLLRKKDKDGMDALSILCANQCEGGGGKVSWWNFYFSEEPGSMPFIKRDKFSLIRDTIIPELLSFRKACVSFSLYHLPGCGGTTLAMHILWSLRDKFRCAVLKDKAMDFAVVAAQVVWLLTYGVAEHATHLPVLLMVDDFEEVEAVYDLEQQIEKEIVKKELGSQGPLVVVLNCMRTEVAEQLGQDTVFLGNNLSKGEQDQFQKKLEDIEKTHKNAETFYGFMIMKKNFLPEYIQGVARNTLKGFSLHHKQDQLIAVLALLHVYGQGSLLSVSLCEEFLGMQTKSYCASQKVEDEFGKFSTLVTRCTVEVKMSYEAVRTIHPHVAEYCLQELTTTYKVSKSEIANLLLTEDIFYTSVQGKDKLLQDIRGMLVKRRHENAEDESRFSPLILAIMKETSGAEESVLSNAAKRFPKNPVISQLLARYHYLKKRDFRIARDWAKKAKELAIDNSYIADTSAQVIKHELKYILTSSKDEKSLITPERLRECLRMARAAIEAFRETQEIARKESVIRARPVNRRDNRSFNTAGCLGEIQVSVIIFDILDKIPVFNPCDPVRHRIMAEYLSGSIMIQDIARMVRQQWHASYFCVLQEYNELLSNLKHSMKRLFDFLDFYFINLGPRYAEKDQREDRTREELFRCFCRYVDVFCKSNAPEPIGMQTLMLMFTIHKARQELEMRKADTYSRLLESLSKNTPGKDMEQIVKLYDLILKHSRNKTVKSRVNYIYANIVLHCIKPASQFICRYHNLINELVHVLGCPIQDSDSLALYFIATALLWPDRNLAAGEKMSEKLGNYISQMRTSFWSQMHSVWHSKKPTVHFYLGKKQGYDRLVPRDQIEMCIRPSQVGVNSFGANGRIRKEEMKQQLLCRVIGEIQNNSILAETPNPGVKIPVTPVYKSQLTGRGNSTRVSFYIGFSMNGPLAFDIESIQSLGNSGASQT
ncbi:SAMD9 protein, partial [Atractosteus spatula]|nr:SAMD9 protein [Atractosteus spatula]